MFRSSIRRPAILLTIGVLIAVFAAPQDAASGWRSTTTSVSAVTAEASAMDQARTLTATVLNTSTVNKGTVTFTVRTSGGIVVGTPVTSGTVSFGVATASYVLPGGTAPQMLTITAVYSGAPSFNPSTGTGTLAVTAPPPPAAVLAERSRADFDADTNSDLLVQNTFTGLITAYLLTGHSVISEQDLSHSITDNNWRIMGTGDFNGDSSPDIVWQHMTEGWVYLWYMDGLTRIDSTYFSRDRVNAGWTLAAVGDFNGDSSPDLVWHNQAEGRVVFWLCDNATVLDFYEMPIVIQNKDWVVAGAADFNGDGETDLLLHNHGYGETGVWLMTGMNRDSYMPLAPGAVMDLGWEVAAIIDANVDTKPDIVWQHTDGSLAIWYMDGLERTSAYSFATMLPANARVGGPK